MSRRPHVSLEDSNPRDATLSAEMLLRATTYDLIASLRQLDPPGVQKSTRRGQRECVRPGR